jgi:Arc/MetJ family transcription regulator
MKKCRVTVNLDEDLVEFLKETDASSVSAAVNEAVRGAVEAEAHRQAVLEWLDELNQKHGFPTDEDYAAAEADLDAIGFGDSRRSEHHSGVA